MVHNRGDAHEAEFEIVNKSSTFGKLKLTLVTAYDKSPCTCKSATGRKRTDVETGRYLHCDFVPCELSSLSGYTSGHGTEQ